jgi:hypothetical protein
MMRLECHPPTRRDVGTVRSRIFFSRLHVDRGRQHTTDPMGQRMRAGADSSREPTGTPKPWSGECPAGRHQSGHAASRAGGPVGPTVARRTAPNSGICPPARRDT